MKKILKITGIVFASFIGLAIIGAIVGGETSGRKPLEAKASVELNELDSLQAAMEAEQKKNTLSPGELSDILKVKGFTVKRISGKNKYSGDKTRLEVRSLYELFSDIDKKAKNEMASSEDVKINKENVQQFAKGGQITLHIERGTIGAANTEYFSYVVKDINEKEICRGGFGESIPEVPIGDGGWWNIATNTISDKTGNKFYVYIIDRLSDTQFKFEVTAKS
jgi:hypothetical protein